MLSTLVSWLPNPVRRQLEHRLTLLRVVENTGWIIANSAVRLVIALVVGVWVARYLGASQFGFFNYAVSLNLLFAIVIPLGMGSIMMRDLARAREERQQIMGSAFYTMALVSVIMVGVAAGVAIFAQHDDPISQKYTLILSIALLAVPFEVLIFWFQSQLMSSRSAIATTISLFVMAVARLWFVYIEASLDAFIYVVLIERFTNLGVMIFLYYKSGESIARWRFELQRAKRLVREGMPLFLSTLAFTIFNRGSELMLMTLAGSVEVGYFAAANKIATLYLLIPTAIVASATPVISKSKTVERTLYLSQLTNLLRVTSAVGVASAAVIGLTANWFMPFIYGEEFAGAGPVLIISLWAAIPFSFSLVAGTWAINEGVARILFEKTLAMAVIVTWLNWYLIPQYGATGAAYSMLIVAILIHIGWDFIDPRMRSYNLLKLHAFLPWWFGVTNIQLLDISSDKSNTKKQEQEQNELPEVEIA